MTTILAVENGKSGFAFAADSQTTSGVQKYVHEDIQKIVEVGDYVIAGAGNSKYVDVFLSKPELLTQHPDDTKSTYEFMVSEFIPQLQRLHEECGYQLKEGEDFEFIVGYKGKLFYIASDYSVLRDKSGAYALGTGGPYALGAWVAGVSILDAVSIAIQIDINSSGPIQYVKRGAHA